MIRRLFFLAVAGSVSLCGQYVYDNIYYNGYPGDGAPWFWNYDQAGYQYPSYDTSVIYTGTVSGTNPNDYEIESGFTYAPNIVHFLRANSPYVQVGVGSYISVELTSTFNSQTDQYQGQINVNQSINGAVTTLASFTVPSTQRFNVVRSVVWGTNLRIMLNTQDIWDMTIPLTTGVPGVGTPLRALRMLPRWGLGTTTLYLLWRFRPTGPRRVSSPTPFP